MAWAFRTLLAVIVMLSAACASTRDDNAWRALEARSETALRADPETRASPVAGDSQPVGPLTVDQITTAVVTNNRRIEAMRYALRAMVHMGPQQMSMPDPTLEVGLAPLVVHTGRGQRVSFRQPLPWPGTLGARGKVALEDALAMEHDLETMQRMLVAMAHMSFWELGAIAELRALWHEHHQLVETLRKGLVGRFSAGRARPQDVMRAEAELIMADQQILQVDRMERQAQSRLKVLMHRPPEAPLGQATWPDTVPPAPPDLATLHAHAKAKRPELAAAEARVRARAAAIESTERMNKPMLGLGVEVSTMADDWMMWPMLMFMVELPLATTRRDAMEDEARARHRQEQYTRDALERELEGEVSERHADLVEALASHQTLTTRLMPALDQRLAFSVAAYGAGQEDFDAVLMAAATLTEARLERVETKLRALSAATQLDLAIGRLTAGASP